MGGSSEQEVSQETLDKILKEIEKANKQTESGNAKQQANKIIQIVLKNLPEQKDQKKDSSVSIGDFPKLIKVIKRINSLIQVGGNKDAVTKAKELAPTLNQSFRQAAQAYF